MTAAPRRSLGLFVAWLLVVAWIAADLALEIANGDAWRSVGFALALLCIIGIRDDLTREPPC